MASTDKTATFAERVFEKVFGKPCERCGGTGEEIFCRKPRIYTQECTECGGRGKL